MYSKCRHLAKASSDVGTNVFETDKTAQQQQHLMPCLPYVSRAKPGARYGTPSSSLSEKTRYGV